MPNALLIANQEDVAEYTKMHSAGHTTLVPASCTHVFDPDFCTIQNANYTRLDTHTPSTQ